MGYSANFGRSNQTAIIGSNIVPWQRQQYWTKVYSIKLGEGGWCWSFCGICRLDTTNSAVDRRWRQQIAYFVAFSMKELCENVDIHQVIIDFY